MTNPARPLHDATSVANVRFDADAPLPAPPEPWASSTMPPARDGPPWLMSEMIAAEPALAERVLTRLGEDGATARLVAAIREAADRGSSIVVTGCGTSEHAALGVAAILRDVLTDGRPARHDVRIEVHQGFEYALDAEPTALCVAVSHEGGTWATNRALAAARRTGARTALITAGRGSPGAALSDIVLATGEQDQSWCHTVGYVSPLLAAAAVGAALRNDPLDPVAVRGLLAAGHDAATASAAEAVASALAGVDRLLVVGSGVDRTSARELALKIEEGTHVPAVARDLETVLHGHLAAADAQTGLVLLLVDAHARRDRMARAAELLAATREIGLPAAALVAQSAVTALDGALTTAGRIAIPEASRFPAPVAGLLGAAVPLQLLTERLARVRGVNPDTLRRTEAPWLRAADRYG